jgi:hypothetical protein
MSQATLSSTVSASDVLGCVQPRLWTPPLRELTPETSYGFDVADYADVVCGQPLDPWQEWAVIHAGELLPNGLPRYRIVLIVVARQNGKTELVKLVTSWWLHVDLPGHPGAHIRPPTVLGTSSKLDYAKESWANLVTMTFNTPALRAECAPRRIAVREANGEQTLTTLAGCRYKIAAANSDAGRSLTIHRLVLDELRQHRDWSAWNAAVPTMDAVPDGQAWCMSNAGSDASVVLNALRDGAVEAIAAGDQSGDVGLFEWSAPEGADPEDLDALRQANPNLGRRKPVAPLLAAARRAKAAGGEELAGFRTEQMCIRQRSADPAIDPRQWALLADPAAVNFAPYADRQAWMIEVSIDNHHAIVVAAVRTHSGLILVDPVRAWTGPTCTKALRAELPGLVDKHRPRMLGWLPSGPAASVTADLAERPGWPPSGVTLYPIKAEVPAICMGLDEIVRAGDLRHPDSELINLHMESTNRQWTGDVWRFARRGQAPINGAYAVAGAVHLVRVMPPPVGKPRLVFPAPRATSS